MTKYQWIQSPNGVGLYRGNGKRFAEVSTVKDAKAVCDELNQDAFIDDDLLRRAETVLIALEVVARKGVPVLAEIRQSLDASLESRAAPPSRCTCGDPSITCIVHPTTPPVAWMRVDHDTHRMVNRPKFFYGQTMSDADRGAHTWKPLYSSPHLSDRDGALDAAAKAVRDLYLTGGDTVLCGDTIDACYNEIRKLKVKP